MRDLLLLFLITHSSLDKTHDIHYKTIIWHNHVRYLTVLILTPTPFWQCQHFMSSCFSASSWQHDTWGMCAAGRSCASHRRTGDRRGAARSMRWTRPWAPAAPINVVSAVITTTKIIIIVQRHHHEQLEPGAQKERLLERNLNCCILSFFFGNLAPVVFVDPVNQDVGIHPYFIVYICFVNITINNVFASKKYKSLDLGFHLLVQGALGHTCWPCARLSPPPNPENLPSLLFFFI